MIPNPMQMFPQGGGQQTNNPLALLMMAFQRGGNPMGLIQQMAAQDPRAAMAMQIMRGKSPQQLRTTVENMAREQGIDLGQMMQGLGINPRR